MANQVDQEYLDQNKGPWLYAIFCTLLGLSIIFVGLRSVFLDHFGFQNIY
jgi:hypothetical protein